MKLINFLLVAVVVLASSVQSVQGQGSDLPSFKESESGGLYDMLLKDRLEVGTRILIKSLDEDMAAPGTSYLGSLNGLDLEDEYAPIFFFVNYNIIKWWGIGLTYDEMTVRTTDPPVGAGDGDFVYDTFIFYTYFRYPNESRYTPFIEIGYADYDLDFEEDPSWFDGGRRQFVTESDSGVTFAGGLDIKVWENFSIDLYIRYQELDAVADYYFEDPNRTGAPQETGTFPLTHISYGIGAKFNF